MDIEISITEERLDPYDFFINWAEIPKNVNTIEVYSLDDQLVKTLVRPSYGSA